MINLDYIIYTNMIRLLDKYYFIMFTFIVIIAQFPDKWYNLSIDMQNDELKCTLFSVTYNQLIRRAKQV